ncbi:MAG: hypothetical protein Q9195_002525 [Heterodermia aff. obscurata]
MHAGRIKRNAESSPLLRLPIEIRRKIFSEVLGNRLIHLKKFDDDAVYFSDSDESSLPFRDGTYARWHILLCDPAAAEPIERGHTEQEKRKDGDGAEISKESDTSTDSSSTEDSYDEAEGFSSDTASFGRYEKEKRIAEKLEGMPPRKMQRLIGHSSEYDYSWWKLDDPFLNGRYLGRSRPLRRYAHIRVIHLCLLRACRQVYNEANEVLWESNIFSFNDVYSFSCFMNERNNHQKSLIKKLRLAVKMGGIGSPSWSKPLTMPLVKSLQGLRFLWLAIHYRPDIDFATFENIGMLDITVFKSTLLDGVRKLATLPLTWVKVIVTNKNLGDYDTYKLPREKLWTQQQREKYGDVIRTRLLAVNGVELLQQENEELKAWSQRTKEREAKTKAMRQPVPLQLPG